MRSREMYLELRTEHTALTQAARPLVAKHLSLAFFNDGDNAAEHVRTAMNHRSQYLALHAHKIPRTEYDFLTWEGKPALCDAIILDTMMNVQDQMLGADDSRSDYMPDGITQMSVLTDDSYDGNGFLWYCINNLYKTMPSEEGYDEEVSDEILDHILAMWEATMQDCSSGILYDLSVAFHALSI